MLKIHGRETSSNVQTVMWLIGELELDYQRLDIGGNFGGTKTPEFIAMNPMGLVPVFQDQDVTLFESQSILRFVAAKYGAAIFWPKDPIQRAPVDQWMEWAKVNFYPVLTYKIFWQLIRTSAQKRDEERVSQGVEELKVLMRIADAQIAKNGWLAADKMTLADISFGTHLYRYFTVPFDRADLPHLKEYYERLCTRAAYAKHAMVSYDALRVEGA